MNTLLAKLFNALPPVYKDIVSLSLRDQPHEKDFDLYRHLEGVDGLLVDVGANWGQSAISLFKVNHSLKVFSLEPNTRLQRFLFLLMLRHPFRFRYLMAGAGNQQEHISLNIPTAKHIDLGPNASFELQEFEKSYVKDRLFQHAAADQGRYTFQALPAKVITLDSLQLAPLIIKMDVEGWELKALQGMEKTLERYHPLLMIELNNREQIFPWLAERGYQFYQFISDPDSISPIESDARCLNMFCLHPQSPLAVRERLLPLLVGDDDLRMATNAEG